ncbi:hypothetical protein [Nonomuraea sp. CA-141351]|uniref:hypothetical protein n=1 Tax=Nonomuraea sp. CA-141351 TaxID=3239996 RepID=UPI003D8B1B5E
MTSRYVLPDPPGSPADALTTTGWDPRFATFWAQSYVGDEQTVFRYGVTPREIPTLEELAELLRTHGIHLPPEIAHQLGRDMRSGGSL